MTGTWTTARRVAVAVAVLIGLGLVVLGALAGLLGGGRSSSPLVPLGAVLVGLVALSAALWKVRGRLDAGSARPVPWADDEPFATPAPERSSDEHPLSSAALTRTVEEAGWTARSAGTVEEGIAVVTPHLRAALIDAMVQGGRDPEEAREALAGGEWTDDRVAASALDPDVSPPRLSIRERLYAWLFPERVVRRRVRRAVQEVAEVADEALPTVPGQTAPRTVPVREPRLEELRRDAEGRLQGAVDPGAIARGPEPPEPELDPDDPDGDDRDPVPGTGRHPESASGRHRSSAPERDRGSGPDPGSGDDEGAGAGVAPGGDGDDRHGSGEGVPGA